MQTGGIDLSKTASSRCLQFENEKKLKARILFPVTPFNIFNGLFPYGLALIGTMAKKAGYEVYSLICKPDEELTNYLDRLIKYIKDNNINIVAISANSTIYPETKNMIKRVRSEGCVTILGGIIVTSHPILIAESIGADFYIYGEGEETFLELIKAITHGKDDYSDIDGLLYYCENKTVMNKPRKPIHDLDSLPFIDHELFDFTEHLRLYRTLFLISSRSCPYSCTFCYNKTHIPYRRHSLNYSFEQLDDYLKYYGENIQELRFNDSLFNTDKSYLSEFCERIKPYGLPYSILSRVSNVDKETMKKLKDSGCYAILYGLESVNDSVLQSMNKKITFKEIENAFEITKSHGIKSYGVLIFGDIVETEETVKENLEFFFANILKHSILLTALHIYPGTKVYDYAVKNGIIQNELEYFESNLPILNISRLSDRYFTSLLEKINRYNSICSIAYTPLYTKNNTYSVSQQGTVSFSVFCPICNNEVHINNIDINTELSGIFGNQNDRRMDCRICCSQFRWHKMPMVETFIFFHKHKEKYYQFFHSYFGKKILVFGMSDVIRYFISAFPELGSSIVGIVDSKYENFHCDSYSGLKVNPPEYAENTDFEFVISGAVYRINEIVKVLQNMGKKVNIINWNDVLK